MRRVSKEPFGLARRRRESVTISKKTALKEQNLFSTDLTFFSLFFSFRFLFQAVVAFYMLVCCGVVVVSLLRVSSSKGCC